MTELCFNLWYYLDIKQRIVAVAARAYILDGSDEEKAAVLLKLSREEYRLVPHVRIEAINYLELKRFGIEEIFKDEFERIRREIPKEIPFPEQKLFFATPLFNFGDGFVPVEIGNGFIRERE